MLKKVLVKLLLILSAVLCVGQPDALTFDKLNLRASATCPDSLVSDIFKSGEDIPGVTTKMFAATDTTPAFWRVVVKGEIVPNQTYLREVVSWPGIPSVQIRHPQSGAYVPVTSAFYFMCILFVLQVEDLSAEYLNSFVYYFQ